jgi:hypothetical protein
MKKFDKIYEKAVHNVLNKIHIPAGNMNLPRRNMPQILQKNFKEYLEWLDSEGIGVEELKVNGADLKPSQLDINEDKVKKMVVEVPDNLDKPIIISNDGYVVDGHHRWLTKINIANNRSYVPINAYKIDQPIRELIKTSMKFPKVKFRDVDNNFYDRPDSKVKDL